MSSPSCLPGEGDDDVVAHRTALLAGVAEDAREEARLYARRMRRLADLERSYRDDWQGDPVMELAGTARIPQGRAGRQLAESRRLVEVLGRSLELLEAGEMFASTAAQLLDLTRNCTDEVLAEVERRVLPKVLRANSVDAHRLVLRAVVEAEWAVDTAATREREERARAQRSVWTASAEDGMVVIGARVDVVKGRRWALDLEELVRAEAVVDRRRGVKRTASQRRADVLTDLPGRFLGLVQAVQQGRAEELLGVARSDDGATSEEAVVASLMLPVRNPMTMYVHTPVSTVLDVDHRAGLVEGGGVVSPYHLRLVRPLASLQRLWVDRDTGVPLGIDPKTHPPVGEPDWDDPEDVRRAAVAVRDRLLDLLRPGVTRDDAEPRHDPSASLRRFIEIRDLTCTGIGCSRAARRCDLDHEVEHSADGPTAAWNLSAKSRRCHLGKHGEWTALRLDDGSTEWTGPAGQTYLRLSPWDAGQELPEDLVLPEPSLDDPRTSEGSLPAPLWTEPPPPADPPAERRTWDDGEPPPF